MIAFWGGPPPWSLPLSTSESAFAGSAGEAGGGQEARRLSPLRRLVFLALLLSLFGLFGELVTRLLVPDIEIRQDEKDGGLIQAYRPLSSAELVSAEFRVRYQINEHGFRDRSGRSVEGKPVGGRVVILGDSFSEGYGVEFDDTYAQVMARALPEAEVWNLARMGASPMFYVFMAREWLPKLNPEVFIVQIFDNDLYENSFRRLELDAAGRFGALPESLRPRSGWLSSLDLALPAAVSRAVKSLRGKSPPRRFIRVGASVSAASLIAPPEDPAVSKAFDFHGASDLSPYKDVLDRQIAILGQLADEVGALKGADGRKIEMILIYAPHRRAFRDSRVAEDVMAANPHSKALREFCKSRGLKYVDTTSVVSRAERDPLEAYFEKDLHWNRVGHAWVGEELVPVVKEALAGRRG